VRSGDLIFFLALYAIELGIDQTLNRDPVGAPQPLPAEYELATCCRLIPKCAAAQSVRSGAKAGVADRPKG
jgi:hypothetical protein